MKDIRRHIGGIPARFATDKADFAILVGVLDEELERGTLPEFISGANAQQTKSATFSIWRPNAQGTWVDTQFNETIYDIGLIPRSVSPVPSGRFIVAARYFSVYVLIAGDVCS